MSLSAVLHARSVTTTRDLDRAASAMDEDAFRAFYDRTARPLRAYLRRITRCAQEAEDVFQEAYYRFYRADTEYQDEAHRRNSLFLIATNLVRDAARRAKRHPDAPLEDEDWTDDAPRSRTPAPERQAAVRTDLARAMAKMTPVQRQLLWLAYAQGASHEEIAGILGLKAVSVRTLLLRARRKLARILNGGADESAEGWL